jgi:predicted Fe-Mo cluster-binding NifX family protein
VKIAFPSDDGATISAHLGRAKSYVVVDGEADQSWETRDKPHHGSEPHDHAAGGGHGQIMFEPLRDCQVLISRGMGQPAFDRAISAGLDVVLTGEESIQTALQAYLQGTLETDMRRVHAHGEHEGHEHA